MSLLDLFSGITSALAEDQESLNILDSESGDGDHGDNILGNFQIVTEALQRSQQQDAGSALAEAAQALSESGQGATAGFYAEGFKQAGQELQGKQGISMGDLLPLLQAVAGGVQSASGAQAGEGTLLDALLPAVMAFAQAKQSNRSDMEAILGALTAARRGAQATVRQPNRYGRYADRDTRGRVDPGAASANTILEGLFQTVLKGVLRP
jgi:dihydroxyacetone kinase-like protein